jgi:hypothetical protein
MLPKSALLLVILKKACLSLSCTKSSCWWQAQPSVTRPEFIPINYATLSVCTGACDHTACYLKCTATQYFRYGGRGTHFSFQTAAVVQRHLHCPYAAVAHRRKRHIFRHFEEAKGDLMPRRIILVLSSVRKSFSPVVIQSGSPSVCRTSERQSFSPAVV